MHTVAHVSTDCTCPQADLYGSVEVSSGIYIGGQQAAAERVLEGQASAQESRFFAGCVNWGPGQLEAEMRSGLWSLAECSRAVALKHCFQLPVKFTGVVPVAPPLPVVSIRLAGRFLHMSSFDIHTRSSASYHHDRTAFSG